MVRPRPSAAKMLQRMAIRNGTTTAAMISFFQSKITVLAATNPSNWKSCVRHAAANESASGTDPLNINPVAKIRNNATIANDQRHRISSRKITGSRNTARKPELIGLGGLSIQDARVGSATLLQRLQAFRPQQSLSPPACLPPRLLPFRLQVRAPAPGFPGYPQEQPHGCEVYH